jgi:sterol desaturase/sphingolipid hydroxylase (fatty acid hydroxylase superfamily)
MESSCRLKRFESSLPPLQSAGDLSCRPALGLAQWGIANTCVNGVTRDNRSVLSTAVTALFEPSSIFYPPYLASALLLSFAWLAWSHGLGPLRAVRVLFSRDAWFSRSSGVDFLLSLFNLTAWRTVIVTVETSAFLAGLGSLRAFGGLLERHLALHSVLVLPTAVEAALATIVTMLCFDFASYAAHRALHASPFLWSLHSVHHAAEQLTPLTTYRQHPLEPLLLNGARGAAAGLGLGFFHLIFPQSTPVVTVLGLGAGFFIYMFTVNLHHSPVPVNYPSWLKRVLVSPHVHHLHHSSEPQHFDRNFGVVFSFWDRFFETYLDEKVGLGELRFGLEKLPLSRATRKKTEVA